METAQAFKRPWLGIESRKRDSLRNECLETPGVFLFVYQVWLSEGQPDDGTLEVGNGFVNCCKNAADEGSFVGYTGSIQAVEMSLWYDDGWLYL